MAAGSRGVGRPRGSYSKKTVKYKCVCCGEERPDRDFYKAINTKIWMQSDRRVLVCHDCVDKLFKEYRAKVGERGALMATCAFLDIPFAERAYQAVLNSDLTGGTLQIGHYVRTLNQPLYNRKSFLTTIMDGDLGGGREEIQREEKDPKVKLAEYAPSETDLQNRRFVIETLGYDPLAGTTGEGMSEVSKSYGYNILSSYLEDETILNDGFRLASVIDIAVMQVQARRISELIDAEMNKVEPERSTIDMLTASRKRMTDAINKVAADNGISSRYAKEGTTRNCFTDKMREMSERGVESVAPNVFDVRTSDVMKQIADLSNKSIIEQLGLGDAEYADMIKQQRELITDLQSKLDAATEENRILHNKLVRGGA